MEKLEKINLEELLKRQALLDEKFKEKKSINERDKQGTIIAYYTELGELFQELKEKWCQWKNGTTSPNKQATLEELSDTFHFYLSYLNYFDKKYEIRNLENVKNKISTLKNALYILTKMEEKSVEEMVGAILIIAENVDADEKEFLEIHHKKFLKNLNIRTKESY